MPFSDVPQRLLDGEQVPRTEIIAYDEDHPALQTDLILFYFVELGVLAKTLVAGVTNYEITPFGQTLRQDFVKRIDGDCPECPECP